MTECIYQISENDKFHMLCGGSFEDEKFDVEGSTEALVK